MDGIVYTKTYSEPAFDYGEILRYTGAKEDSLQIRELIEQCVKELSGKLVYKICYSNFSVRERDGELDFGFAKTTSSSLLRNLKECDTAIFFAATIGIEIDRMIVKYSHISPAKALVFQAIGAERIESLCNVFNEEINEQAETNGRFTRPRFSPGYGDFSLSFQKEMFQVLDCYRKIGLSLNESLLMTPSKSVTALIGIGTSECRMQDGCSSCTQKNCLFRSKL